MRRGARFALVCAATMLAVSCGGADDRRPPAPGDQGGRATILYKDRVVEVARTLNDANDLWVVPEDLPRINDFILKPEGACLDELCIPVRQDRESEMYVKRAGQGWFNVTGLARRLQQEFLVDREHGVWSFGGIPVSRNAFMQTAAAPDFTLPDRDGKMVSLSDFRGKKVLIVTWASW